MSGMNNNTCVLSCHPKVEETLRPFKSIDLVEVMFRNVINDKKIEILKMKWSTLNTSIRFRVGYNQTMKILLEDLNINYIWKRRQS